MKDKFEEIDKTIDDLYGKKEFWLSLVGIGIIIGIAKEVFF